MSKRAVELELFSYGIFLKKFFKNPYIYQKPRIALTINSGWDRARRAKAPSPELVMSKCGCDAVGGHVLMTPCLHPTPRPSSLSLPWKKLRGKTRLKTTVAVATGNSRGSFTWALNQTVGGLLLPRRESSEEKVRSKKRVFFLDVNPLCYTGSTPSLHSFGHWVSLFFQQVSLSDPVIAVSSFYPSMFLSFCYWVETWDWQIPLVVISRRNLCSTWTSKLKSTVAKYFGELAMGIPIILLNLQKFDWVG